MRKIKKQINIFDGISHIFHRLTIFIDHFYDIFDFVKFILACVNTHCSLSASQ